MNELRDNSDAGELIQYIIIKIDDEQYGINIKIIVMKNGFLGMVREHQHYAYEDNYSMVELKGDPDLSLIAAAYGMGYKKVNGNSDIEAELADFLGDDESCLMEVRVDPMELVKF